MAVRVKTLGSGEEWGSGGVYSLVREGSKESFWEERTILIAGWEVTWVLEGDFNTIRLQKERV